MTWINEYFSSWPIKCNLLRNVGMGCSFLSWPKWFESFFGTHAQQHNTHSRKEDRKSYFEHTMKQKKHQISQKSETFFFFFFLRIRIENSKSIQRSCRRHLQKTKLISFKLFAFLLMAASFFVKLIANYTHTHTFRVFRKNSRPAHHNIVIEESDGFRAP